MKEDRAIRASSVEGIARDLHFGWRTLRRNPLFTLAAVLTLALTIGSVSTVITIANTLFLKPLPVTDPATLVEVAATREGSPIGLVSYPDYRHFREGTVSLQGLAAHYPTAPLFVTVGERAGEINGAVVSANYFPLLGIQPRLGRFFRPDEDEVAGRDRVTVVSHDFWQSWLAGTADVVGATLGVNGVNFTVVGVAPPSFSGLSADPIELFLPTMMLATGYRWCADAFAPDCTVLKMIGRLDEGRSINEARAELQSQIPQRWVGAQPGHNSGVRVSVPRGAGGGEEDVRLIQLLSLVAAVLLLVCCANLAGLLTARTSSRGRELATRAALGASSGRLARQLLTESVLLALCGGLTGIVLSTAMASAVNGSFFTSDAAGRPQHFDFSLEPLPAAGVLGIALLAGLLFGVVPALVALRGGPAAAIRGQAASLAQRSGVTRWLLIPQTAVAVALVAMALFLAVSVDAVVDGFEFKSEKVALLRLRPRLLSYPPERANQFVQEAVRRLEGLPGVVSVSLRSTGGILDGLQASVASPEAPGLRVEAVSLEIGGRYFETIGVPLLRGRPFDSRDHAASQPVAIVSRSLSRRLGHGDEIVGSELILGGVRRSIVGVVPDVVSRTRAGTGPAAVYVPYWQNPAQVDARVQVRVEGDPASALPTLVRTVHQIDPDVPISETITLADHLAGTFRGLRMGATFASFAAAMTALVSALGLYAAVSFGVNRRTQEFGIRKAVGAADGRIIVLVARQGLSVVLPGVLLGLALAAGSTHLLGHVLYGSVVPDALLYALAATAVGAVSMLACLLPARRAAAVDPAQALKLD